MKKQITPNRIRDAILWIRCMKRIGNLAAARRWERHLLALIAALLLVACSGDTFTRSLFTDAGGETDASSADAGDTDSDPNDAGADAGELADVLDAGDTGKMDAGADAKPLCPDPNDVVHGGRCYYLDGSKGACDQGYTLSSNAALAAILNANANAWQGKSYKHVTADNVCLLTKDNVQNYGLLSNAAPFVAGEPVANGSSCWMISPPFMNPKQLTLCESQ